MNTTHDRLPLINEGFAFKKAGERITHSEWNAVLETFAKCYNNLVLDTDKTASTILLALADKAEQTHTHDIAAVKGLSEHIAAAIKANLNDKICIGSDEPSDDNTELWVDTAEDYTKGNYVLCSTLQNLTDEQKETARNNIGAVDASRVVDSLSDTAQIPNAVALSKYTEKFTGHQCVRCDKAQGLSDQLKQTARANIGAISQAELDEAIANVGGGTIAKPNWEHIATITVTPDEDGNLPTKIIFSADDNNEAFALTSFYIFSHAGFTDANSTLYASVNNRDIIVNCSNLKHTSLRYNSILYRQTPDGYIEVAVSQSGGGAFKFNAQSPMGYQNIIMPISESYVNYLEVKSITLYTGLGANKTWLNGSTFELYGVRK